MIFKFETYNIKYKKDDPYLTCAVAVTLTLTDLNDHKITQPIAHHNRQDIHETSSSGRGNT